jgi:DNA-binding response OmpR family regulator
VPVLLLVEDHADTRTMYAEFLRDIFDVMQAADGAEALASMRQRAPDLVITDLSLPQLDGFELLKEMRADTVLAKVPVICLSGYSDDAHEQRALDAGADRVLQKPCLPDRLAQAAAALLRDRAGADADC